MDFEQTLQSSTFWQGSITKPITAISLQLAPKVISLNGTQYMVTARLVIPYMADTVQQMTKIITLPVFRERNYLARIERG
jgi:hypothetical protein